MLKLFSALLVAALLAFGSPARADETAPCAKVDEVIASITAVPLLVKVDGVTLDALKEKYAGTLPAKLDTLLIFGARGAPLFRTVGFVDGCAQGVGVMSPNIALPLAGEDS